MKARRILVSAAKAFASAAVGTLIGFTAVGQDVDWRVALIAAVTAGVKAAWKWLDLLVAVEEPGA